MKRIALAVALLVSLAALAWAGFLQAMVDWINVDTGLFIIAFAALIVSIVSVRASVVAVREAKNTAQANIVSGFLEMYASKEMGQHLKKLKKFEDENSELLEKLTRITDNINNVDNDYLADSRLYETEKEGEFGPARRYVSIYYRRAWPLHCNDYLDEKVLGIIAETDGIDLLFRVVWPISLAHNLVEIHNGNLIEFLSKRPKIDWFDDLRKFRNERINV